MAGARDFMSLLVLGKFKLEDASIMFVMQGSNYYLRQERMRRWVSA